MALKKPGKINTNMLLRGGMIMILDVLAIMISFFMGLWFRADFSFENIREVHMAGYLSAIGPWCAITIVVCLCFKIYKIGRAHV